MARAVDAAGVPLVVLADVDQLRVLLAPQRVGLLGRDVAIPCHRQHGSSRGGPGAIHTDDRPVAGDHAITMRILTAAALSVLAAVAGAGPAHGASFTSPRTLADWEPGGTRLVAAPGAAAWTHADGLRFWRDGDALARIPGREGMVQDIAVGAPAARPFVAWVDSAMQLHAFTERDELVAGTTDRVRNLAAAPSALAWVGVAKRRHAQGAARRPPVRRRVLGCSHAAAARPPVFDIAAAGDRERTLVVWPVTDGGVRRVELLTIDAGDRVSEPRWVTGADRDAGGPTVAVGPGGSGLVAWVDGVSSGPVIAAPVDLDGGLGAPQTLDTEPGGPPDLDVGRGGAAVAVWPAGGNLRVALRSAGAAGFAAPVTLTAENLLGLERRRHAGRRDDRVVARRRAGRQPARRRPAAGRGRARRRRARRARRAGRPRASRPASPATP